MAEKREWMMQIPKELKSYNVTDWLFLLSVTWRFTLSIHLMTFMNLSTTGSSWQDTVRLWGRRRTSPQSFKWGFWSKVRITSSRRCSTFIRGRWAIRWVRSASSESMKLIALVANPRRWTAIKWPQKIIDQMEAVAVQHEEDEARFYKMQLVDRDHLEESLDSLKVSWSLSFGLFQILFIWTVSKTIRSRRAFLFITSRCQDFLYGVKVSRYYLVLTLHACVYRYWSLGLRLIQTCITPMRSPTRWGVRASSFRSVRRWLGRTTPGNDCWVFLSRT